MKFENGLLRDFAEIQTGPFGSQLHKEDYVIEGTPIVTVEHLGNKIFTEQNLPRVSDEDKKRLNKYVLQEGDIVFSRVGSVDRCSFVDINHSGWMFSGRCLRVRPNNQIDPMYLYYYFCMESTRKFLRSIAVGATMPSINTKLMGEVQLLYPEKEIQQKISTILSALDDKISLNQTINENLEQQAQAIYTKLFSATVFNNIDCGWRVTSLDKVTEKIHTRAKDKEYKVMSAISAGSLIFSEEYFSKKVYSNSTKNYIVVEENMFAYNPARINIGSIGMNDLGVTGCVSPVYVVFKTEPMYQYFFDFFFKTQRFKEEVKNRASGSVRQTLNYEDFGVIEIVYPPESIVEKFNNLYFPILEHIQHRNDENIALQKIRDTLLPKLMSGEIDVSEIDL